MYFHKPQEKPRKWGSFQDVQYAIRKNAEKIYQIDPDSIVLCMPLFWGLPPLDYSKFGNHGTNYGATYQDGSLDFDGVDDYVNASTTGMSTVIGTVSAWAKVTGIGSGPGTEFVFFHRVPATNTRIFLQKAAAADYSFTVGIGEVMSADTGSDFVQNEWVHIALVWDTGSYDAYFNGDKVIDGGSYANFDNLNSEIYFGKAVASNREIDGLIDETYISNVVCTADQIALFHDRPWGLYRPVSRPVYFFQAAAGISIPVAMQNMRGGFNPIGMRGGFINAD